MCDDADDEAGQFILNPDGDVIRIFSCSRVLGDGTIQGRPIFKTITVNLNESETIFLSFRFFNVVKTFQY